MAQMQPPSPGFQPPPADNPYQPPRSDLQDGEDPQWVSPEEIASTGARIGNMILDNVFYLMLSLIVGAGLGVISALFNMPGILTALDNTFISYGFGFAISLLYFVPQEAGFGRTLGKLITGTKVVMENGSPPTFGATVIRTLCRFIPFEAFSFLGGDRPIGWHDSLSGTRVISTRR